jgi:molybdopterin-dependent oxidoreductase alpha subunit
MCTHIPNESNFNLQRGTNMHASNESSSSHKDENSAPDQEDHNKPRPVSMERPMTTPEVSKRTPNAQLPSNDQIGQIHEPHRVAAGWPAIYETMLFAKRESIPRTTKGLLVMNHKGGFDCPSCAWPDPDGMRSPTEFCENGAKAVAWEATKKKVGPDFFAKHSIAELGQQTEQWLGDQGRITQPMVLARGSQHYKPIAWQAAFKLIADELNSLQSADEATFYTSGRTSNEAAFMYQLFVRQFGTNNLPDCSNMCHESSGLGLTESIGIGKGTVKLEDFDHADCIFIIGQNPGTCHPRMLTALEKAVRNGCKIISINPLIETGMIRFKHPQSPVDLLGHGTKIACLFLPVKINGDVAVIKGIMKSMWEADKRSGRKVFDHEFIRDKTHGFEEFVADLQETSWESIIESSGVSKELIEEAADIAGKSERMITCWAMGITQHKNGVANVQMISNFNLLRGQIGRQGAGVCPVRGHSNVQGDRTVGIWEKMSDAFMEKLGKEFNFIPPEKHGFDAVASLQGMHEGTIKVFFAMGGNFLSANPDTEYAAEAFRRTRLSVQVSTKLNRNHLITGEQALILPCLGRTEHDMQSTGEQFVSCENSMGVVQESKGTLAPSSTDLMSEVAIICHLAAATLKDKTTVDWMGCCANYDLIRDHIEHVVPGFDNYNKRVREPGGFYLPNAVRDKQEFHTKTKKANFFVHPFPKYDLLPGQLLMMSVRSHDQFNTTIYGQNDRYRGIFGGRRVIFMNPEDIAERNLVGGEWVDITSHYHDQQRIALRFKVVPYEIPRGSTATYYPETNVLVPLEHVADSSNQPASKSIVITVATSAVPV